MRLLRIALLAPVTVEMFVVESVESEADVAVRPAAVASAPAPMVNPVPELRVSVPRLVTPVPSAAAVPATVIATVPVPAVVVERLMLPEPSLSSVKVSVVAATVITDWTLERPAVHSALTAVFLSLIHI